MDGDDDTCYSYRYTWDVFLSFRGEDTRDGFIAKLYDELVRRGVRAFRDDEGMERGDEIAPTLLAAIEDSAVAIVVISKNYADSKWCLDELAKIVELAKINRKLLIPVFYGVEPSDVQRQENSFKEDFQKHEQNEAAEKVKRWRNAMEHAGNISGDAWPLREESELINNLVMEILKILNKTPMGVAKYQVGLENHLEILLKKIDAKVQDVRIIGLFGMGGIGKTTLAKALYNKLAVHFRRRIFLSSVREESQKQNGLESLQNKVTTSLNSSAPQTINNMKDPADYDPILLVLDDVDNSKQLDALVGKRDIFHEGSRIIITSRDENVLQSNLLDEEIHEVKKLTPTESLQLFSYHACGREKPDESLMNVSKKIVEITDGVPLALEVFGASLFHNRSIKVWNDELEKLKQVHPGNLQEQLEISYWSLDASARAIFLDIACFFAAMKMTREDAIYIFRGCGFSGETVIRELTEKSLIRIIDENVLWMHDQLRDMGREIVRRESYENAGLRSRLWDQGKILNLLKNYEGTTKILGITLEFKKQDQNKSPTRFQLPFVNDFLKKIYTIFVGRDEQQDDESLCTKAFIFVQKILNKLNNTPMGVAKYPVGLENRLEILLKKIDVKVQDVRVIGFFGMGGIGKTTLAKALYNKLVIHFRRRIFLSSVREESQKSNGLKSLQEKVTASLNSSAPQTINNMKDTADYDPILLVLDDVDNSKQLDALVGKRDTFHEGSRIIITSRDKNVLQSNLLDEEISEVKELTFTESLQLFSYHACGRDKPDKSLMDVSEKIVEITGGLPLALEVFGASLFYKRSIKVWNDELEKLKKVPPGNLQKLLEISYWSLDENTDARAIFLDIACFFAAMKMTREDAIYIFRGCGFSGETVITELTAKSLIKIIDENVLWMHDQLRDMGREIVRRESYEDAGLRSRLWDQGEILNVLKNDKGTTKILGITLEFKKQDQNKSPTRFQLPFVNDFLKKIYTIFVGRDEQQDDESLCTKAFIRMVNLRLLQIDNAKLDGSFKFIPAELKWLQWKGCSLSCLPLEFQPRDLAVLDLSESKISHLWKQKWWDCHSKKMGKKLLVVNLYACRNLQEIPDLSGMCIEKLILEHCSALVKIHKSIGDMSNLTYLNLRECENLEEFPSDVSGLKSLEKLFLSGCSKLRNLPEDMSGFKSLKELLVDRTAIIKLPDSIFRLKNLEILNLNDCRNLTQLPISIGNLSLLRELFLDGTALEEIPESLGNLTNLKELSLRRCSSLTQLPEKISDLKSLSTLHLQSSSVKNLPESIGSLCHLKLLSMNGCKKLIRLPDSIGKLLSLVLLDLHGTPISEIPSQIGSLNALKELDIGDCLVKVLPESFGNLSNLKRLISTNLSIHSLPESFGSLERLETLHLTNCEKLTKLPASFGKLKSLGYLYMNETAVTELPVDIGDISNLRVFKMRKKTVPGVYTDGTELPASFSNLTLLEQLDAYAFNISGKISDDFEKLSLLESLNLSYNDISNLPSSLTGLWRLKELLLANCKKLVSLPPLPLKLIRLSVANCSALEIMPDLSDLVNLQELELMNCNKVTDIPGLEKLKSLRMLYAGGCNAYLSAVQRRLSKVALRRMHYLCVPGRKIPNWFIPEVPNFSCPRNRKLKGVIIGVVVSLSQETLVSYRDKLPAIVDIQAKIIRHNVEMLTTRFRLMGVPNTNEDQLYFCRYHDYNNLVMMLEEGDMLKVAMREPPYFKGLELKKYGIQLVFENDDEYEDCDDALFTDEKKQSVSKRLSNFFNSQ